MPDSPATYFLTGANRGLGLEFVRQISSSPSATIFAGVRSLSGELDDLKALSSSTSATVHILECNVSSLDSIRAACKQVVDKLGGSQLDYLLNNAGINANPERTALDVQPEHIREHIEVNVVGPAEIVKGLEPVLGRGSVVMNMTSGLGSVGKGIVKCTAYAISKGALNMLTAHQADALREKGVRVIVMDPGWVKTRMGGDGAILEPEESIGGMLKVVRKGGMEDSGSFYEYSGEKVPW